MIAIFAASQDKQQNRLYAALHAFIEDLLAIEAGRTDRFRPGLRVNGVQGEPGMFEMTWAPNGRATFSWGKPVSSGKWHVIWERCGDHSILP